MTEVTTSIGLSPVEASDNGRRLAVVISLILILLAAGAALFLVRGVDTQLADVARTYEVRRYARELMLALTDAETGQRGYLLTQDRTYLAPYEEAVGSIDASYDRLVEILAPSPEQRAAMAALKEPIDQKRAEMASTIQLASTGRLDEALLVLRSDAGNSIMGNIREQLQSFIAVEDERLIERNAQVERYRQWLVAAILAALAASATLAYALFTRTQKQVSALARTRQQLLVQNEELEAHIRERTAEVEEARAHAERERLRVEALLRDTNHRIGNSLATVSSLLGLQYSRSRSDEVRTALEAAQSRVQGIASAHRRLRLGDDLETAKADEFLEAVIEDIRAAQPLHGKIEFLTGFDAIEINARDATTIGIVLGELVTNAIKHAFPDGRPGTIWVRLSRNAEGIAVLTVEDDGRGLDPGAQQRPKAESGLGSMIIQQLAMQFGGESTYSDRVGGGTVVSVTLPGLNRPPPPPSL